MLGVEGTRTRGTLLLVAALLWGCGGGGDGGGGADASPDARPDAAGDAGGRTDSGPARDGGGDVDGGPAPDGGSDAGGGGDAGSGMDGGSGSDAGSDAGGGTDAGSGSCTSNAECGRSGYCAGASCDGPGSCELRPTVCTREVAPVCGCDGRTYSNRCVAASNGVRVAFEGECPTTSGCRSNRDCGATEFCAGEGCTAAGTCQPRPEVCPGLYAPVCGCDGGTYSNLCEAAAAGVRVASDGPCDGAGP